MVKANPSALGAFLFVLLAPAATEMACTHFAAARRAAQGRTLFGDLLGGEHQAARDAPAGGSPTPPRAEQAAPARARARVADFARSLAARERAFVAAALRPVPVSVCALNGERVDLARTCASVAHVRAQLRGQKPLWGGLLARFFRQGSEEELGDEFVLARAGESLFIVGSAEGAQLV